MPGQFLPDFELVVSNRGKILNDINSEIDKSFDLSLRGLAPAQSQMNLFLDTLCARNKGPPILTKQKKLCYAGTSILKIDSFVTVLGSPPKP